jgi:hypothetical protein
MFVFLCNCATKRLNSQRVGYAFVVLTSRRGRYNQ